MPPRIAARSPLRRGLLIAVAALLTGLAVVFVDAAPPERTPGPAVPAAPDAPPPDPAPEPVAAVPTATAGNQRTEDPTPIDPEALESLQPEPEPPPPPAERVVPRELTGRVVALGEPVANALVIATLGGSDGWGELPRTEVASARTDDDGHFTLGPAVGSVTGLVRLFVASSAHPNHWFTLPVTPQADVEEAIDPEPPTFDLRTGELLTGTLLWRGSGLPAIGVRVTALQIGEVDLTASLSTQLARLEAAARKELTDDLEPLTAVTDALGRFEFVGVERGTAQLVLSPGVRFVDGDRHAVAGGFWPLEVEAVESAVVLVDESPDEPGDFDRVFAADEPFAFVPAIGSPPNRVGERADAKSWGLFLARVRGDAASGLLQPAVLGWRGLADPDPLSPDESRWSSLPWERAKRSLWFWPVETEARTAWVESHRVDAPGGSTASPSWIEIRPHDEREIDPGSAAGRATIDALLRHVRHPRWDASSSRRLRLRDELGVPILEPVLLTLRRHDGEQERLEVTPDPNGYVEADLLPYSHLSARVATDDARWPRPFVERHLPSPRRSPDQTLVVSRPSSLTVERPAGLEGDWVCEVRSADSTLPDRRFTSGEEQLEIEVLPPGRWFVGRGPAREALVHEVVVLAPGQALRVR